MPLASKDGKLYYKIVIVDGEEKIQLCSSCCSAEIVGKCCQYPWASSGPQPANTAAEARQLAAESAKAESAAIPNSIWTIGVWKTGAFVEGGVNFDPSLNQYTCDGFWTLGEPGECRSSTKSGCLSGPFSYFTPNATCEGPDDGLYDCPENPPDGGGGGGTENPGDCGYCIHYRFAPGTGTTTHVVNCVTREYCQERADRGENVQFFPWECMPEGGADFVVNGEGCAEDRSLPCCNYDPEPITDTGRCCLYKGEALDLACGETFGECQANAEELKESVDIGFYKENDIVFNEDGDEGCQYSVMVYQYIPEAVVPICHDKDKDGNPITESYCEELNTDDVYKAIFTEGEECGETSIGGRGTCPDQPPTDERSNPLP